VCDCFYFNHYIRVIHEAEPLNCPSLVSMEDALKIGNSPTAAAAGNAIAGTANESTTGTENEAKAEDRAQGNTMKIGLNLWFTDLPNYPRPEMSEEGSSLGYASADVQQGK